MVSKTKQDLIYNIIEESGEISQPEIVKRLLKEGLYGGMDKPNKASARVSVTNLLKKLVADDRVKLSRQIENEAQGGIMKNIWSVK
jgi:hypothetical protein